MAIDLEIWWLCSLSFIIVIEYLGPNLVAIGKMVKIIFLNRNLSLSLLSS
jgi:hypothetical protein